MGKRIGIVTGFVEQLVACTYENHGLGVHRWPLDASNNWNVTHIASGLSVAKFAKTKKQAVGVVKALVSLTDWTRPVEELHNGASDLGRQAKRIVERHAMVLTDGHPSQNSIPLVAREHSA